MFESIFALNLYVSLDMGGVIKKLFGFKRFASVEFTAKQAFENIDVAMILLQLLLLFLLFTGSWYFLVCVMRQRRKRKIRRLHLLIRSLAVEKFLLNLSKSAGNKDDINRYFFSLQETSSQIYLLFKHRYVQRRLSKNQIILIDAALNLILTGDDITSDTLDMIIEQLLGIFESL